MNRKLIRPSLSLRGDFPGPHRRPAALQGTHAEAGYLQHAVESGAPFVVELLGGEEIRGRLQGHDEDVLILAGEDGSAVVLRKERVRTYRVERR